MPLNRLEVLRMLVGLNNVGDLDLVNDDVALDKSCVESDKPTIRAMASIISHIYDAFDYEASPEFLTKLEGKSLEVQTMHRKLLDGGKRMEAQRRLGIAIVAILDSDDAFKLVPVEMHDLLHELRHLVERLSDV